MSLPEDPEMQLTDSGVFADPEAADFSIDDFNSPILNSGEGGSAMGDPRWVN